MPGEQIEIRRAEPSDVDKIGDVHVRSWRSAYRNLLPPALIEHIVGDRAARVDRLRTRINDPQASGRYWVALAGNEILGFAVSGASRDPDAHESVGEVMAIYLAPEAIGRGIGRTLLERAVDDLRERGFVEATLWVLTTNHAARGFYEHLGWLADGATKDDERPGGVLHEVRYRRRL